MSLVGPCYPSLISILSIALHTMIASARPLFANLLISIVLLGHAPAWLHLADHTHSTTFGSPHQFAKAGEGTSKWVTTCSCHHHRRSRPETDPPPGSPELPDEDSGTPEHDRCVVCQSLVSALGVVDNGCDHQLIVPLVTTCLNFDVPFVADQRYLTAQPRGPPSLST